MFSKLLSYFRAKHDHQFIIVEERPGWYHSVFFWGPQNEVFWYGPGQTAKGETTFLREISSGDPGRFVKRIAKATVQDDPSVRTDIRRLFEKMKEGEGELGETKTCKVYLARITTSRRELAENPYEPSCCRGYDYLF